MGAFVMETGLWVKEFLFHLPLLIPFHLLVQGRTVSNTHKDVGLGKLFYASLLLLRGVWSFTVGAFPWSETAWYITWLSLEFSVFLFEINRSFLHLSQRSKQAYRFCGVAISSMLEMVGEFNECQM